MPKEILTQSELSKAFLYNPITGDLSWRVSPSTQVDQGKIINGVNSSGYTPVKYKNITYMAHRIIWTLFYGEIPEEIDHINGIRNDNRICNLRSVTHTENQRNAKIRSHNTSGHTGVLWDKKLSRWVAQIGVNGRHKYIGCFSTIFDAVCARKTAEIEYGYHRNHGRRS